MARIVCGALLGLALVACGGSSVDKELAGADSTPEESTPEEPTPDPAVEAPVEPVTEALEDGEGIRYNDIVVRVGDRVRLTRRVGTITPSAGTGGTPVEAAAGKTGQVTAIEAPSGLVEVTWDAQKWTLHGGYAWEGKETIEVADLEGLASRSGGDVQLDAFPSTIHLGYLEVVAGAADSAGNP